MLDLVDIFEHVRSMVGGEVPPRRKSRPKKTVSATAPAPSHRVSFPMRVGLMDWERKLIELTARQRFQNDRHAGIHDRRVQSDLFGWKRDLLGMAGEFVFGKGFGVWVDWDTSPRSGGVDCKLPTGLTVDVKATDRPQGRLICPLKDPEKLSADIFVLVNVTLPLTEEARQRFDKPAFGIIQGWAWAEDMLDRRAVVGLKKQDSGDVVDTYVINNTLLHRTQPKTAMPTREDYPCVHNAVSDRSLKST